MTFTTRKALRRAACLALVVSSMLAQRAGGETLYNGIELPATWPPRLAALPDALPVPPYLVSPPDVISIDLGRQLFVDDFLIEETTLVRRFHRPTWHPANPVLTADKEWELGDGTPMAMPFSGGVWYDPADRMFKLWYMGGYNRNLCYATSPDGVSWTRPDLDVVPGTNIVIPGGATESNTLWLDLAETDPQRRCKFFSERGGAIGFLTYRTSPDGIHGWSAEQWQSGRCGDRSTVFYNPFRKKWVFNLRESYPPGYRGRAKRYWEADDVNDSSAAQWPAQNQAPLWVTADRGQDAPDVRIGLAPQLYHLDCLAYESVMLGMFSIFRGYFHADSSEGRAVDPGRPKHNSVSLGFSRDGFHWQRPDHRTFLDLSDERGAWNWGNVQSVGGGVLVVGDQLYFYASGRAGESRCQGSPLSSDAAGSTGLAMLRRDGFASMDAEAAEATLTTRKVRFSGTHLFVNANAAGGSLRAELLDANGQPIAPFTKDNCLPLRANATLQPVAWKGAADLSAVARRPVRLRFTLTAASLYSFWVSGDAGGASGGFVGAGGPGFASHCDNVDRSAGAGNQPPLADAGLDQTLRAGDQGWAEVTLDASDSADDRNAIARFEWRENGKLLATGIRPTVKLGKGEHRITLAATDADGASGYASLSIAVLPQTDPVPPRGRLVLWLQADALAGLRDGEPVSAWRDSSPTGLDPFQPDANKRPVWKANAVNGLPAVRFDGDDDNLRTRYYRDLLFTSYGLSVFAVFRPAGEVESRGLVSSNWTALGTSRDQGGSLVYSTAFPTPAETTEWLNVNAARAGAVRPGEWTIGAVIRSGDQAGQTHLLVNGSRNDDGAAIPYHSMNAEYGYIGCLRSEAGGWKGDIAEILIYGQALPEPDVRAVQEYLSRKYKIDVGGKP